MGIANYISFLSASSIRTCKFYVYSIISNLYSVYKGKLLALQHQIFTNRKFFFFLISNIFPFLNLH